jgi:hypothetical protein
MMTGYLIGIAALALLTVGVGEVRDLRRRRRLADAGRSRLPAPVQRE